MLMLSRRTVGFIEPCLPSPAKVPPSGPSSLREIKHGGFRLLAGRDAKGVRLLTRNGYNFAERFPVVVAAVVALPCALLPDSTARPSSPTSPGSRFLS